MAAKKRLPSIVDNLRMLHVWQHSLKWSGGYMQIYQLASL
jgi:hypothetical protein